MSSNNILSSISCPTVFFTVQWTIHCALGILTGCARRPPPYLLNPPPESHRHSWKDKQSLVRASRLLQSHPYLLSHTTPCHPQRPSPCLLPAHTRGGSVCGRGEVCCRFWRWTSVGWAHAHPNQPWPPPTVNPLSYSSTTNARLVLRLPRLDRMKILRTVSCPHQWRNRPGLTTLRSNIDVI